MWAVLPQARAHRSRDRVETTPEQLASAAIAAERLSSSSGHTTCCVGWYHSHPHITVLPSHVDLRTQAQLQQLSAGFVGLILSCFDSSRAGHRPSSVQLMAFQSQLQDAASPDSTANPVAASWSRKDVAVVLSPLPHPAERASPEGPIPALVSLLAAEEREAYLAASAPPGGRKDSWGGVGAQLRPAEVLHCAASYQASGTREREEERGNRCSRPPLSHSLPISLSSSL